MYKPHNNRGGKKFGGGGNWKRSGDDRFEDRPPLHDATCDSCHQPCQVPFRPTGVRPVYCRNCFKKDGDSPKRFGDKRSFSGRSEGSGDMEQRLKSIEKKIDLILEAITESDE